MLNLLIEVNISDDDGGDSTDENKSKAATTATY